jgi:hypothetical protein
MTVPFRKSFWLKSRRRLHSTATRPFRKSMKSNPVTNKRYVGVRYFVARMIKECRFCVTLAALHGFSSEGVLFDAFARSTRSLGARHTDMLAKQPEHMSFYESALRMLVSNSRNPKVRLHATMWLVHERLRSESGLLHHDSTTNLTDSRV